MLKVGIVGAGFWSEKHFKAWTQVKDAEITAVCDRDLSKAAARAEEFGLTSARLFSDVEEMLRSTDIDCVDLITRPDSHLKLVELAARAGKHILCQKPFAPTFEEASRMVELANGHGVRMMVAENWRWLTPFRLAGEVLEGGQLGAIRLVRYDHYDDLTPKMSAEREHELDQPYMRYMPKLMFYEMGSHWFDLWRFLFGNPKSLYADIRRISPNVAGEDSGIVILDHGKFHGVMNMNWASRQYIASSERNPAEIDHESLTIEGELASLFLSTSGTLRVIDNEGKELFRRAMPGLTKEEHEIGFQRLIAHFAESLRTGGVFATEAGDHLETLKLQFAVYGSAEAHRPVVI